MLIQRKINKPKKQELEDLEVNQKESVTRETNLTIKEQNSDSNFLRAENAEKGRTYRTAKGVLVDVYKFDRKNERVVLRPKDTESEVSVPYNYALYLDVNNPLVAERKLEFGETEGADGYGEKRKRKGERKETKTSSVDTLLREGKELPEVVEIISEKYNEDKKKVKRLVWSRRALLKKEKKNNGEEKQ